jgi:hypothetical protein
MYFQTNPACENWKKRRKNLIIFLCPSKNLNPANSGASEDWISDSGPRQSLLYTIFISTYQKLAFGITDEIMDIANLTSCPYLHNHRSEKEICNFRYIIQ